MKNRKRLLKMQAQKQERFPLPEGKSELFNYQGEMRRWNTNTGKYDLKA
tara:strand:+ start:205 stop:351 length:147 start_codon:yes stop_codon:yes gene_type:complete